MESIIVYWSLNWVHVIYGNESRFALLQVAGHAPSQPARVSVQPRLPADLQL